MGLTFQLGHCSC